MQQLNIEHCTQADADQLSALLESFGALSVTMTDQFDDPILEPEPGTVPLWPNVVMQALYESDVNIAGIMQKIQQQYPRATCSVETLAQQDWERVCLDQFQPQRFGKRLWVCPSWHAPPEPEAVNLILDPGLAFGTGSHATTALCLSWLAQATLQDKTVVDYGCGSGILSIAALKLGARHVQAVDIDPQALTATQSNAQINAIVPDTLRIDYPNGLQPPVDMIIANILLTPLMDLKQSFHHLLNSQGVLTISGILANQSQVLIEHYQSHFQLLQSEREGDWILLVFEKINDDLDHTIN